MFCITLGHTAQNIILCLQIMINESFRKSWPIIDLCKSQEKKMKGKCTWRKLHEDKHNCSNQNKAWSHWHITLTFSSDTCINLAFALFLFCFVLRPTWIMETNSGLHVQHATLMFMFALHFYLSNPNLYDNNTKYRKLYAQTQRRDDKKHPIQPPLCHFSPSPRINTHLAQPL